jgi:transposase
MASSRTKPWIVDDELWGLIEPLLPQSPRRFRYPGRRRLDDRLVLQGILFVLHTGIGWEHLPQELGFGSGMTAWRRLHAGRPQESGSGCTLCCSSVCRPPARSTGLGRSSMPHMCRPKKGLLARAEPGRPRPGGRQAPRPDRRPGALACLVGDGGQPQRRHRADRAGRRDPACPGPHRAATAPARTGHRRSWL